MGALVIGLVAIVLALPAPARAGSGGHAGPSTPGGKAESDSLTYDSFTGFNCSQSGFFTSAMAHLNVNGPATMDGTTSLDGVPYDTYALDLGTGPATFPTDFSRAFTSPQPASSTYTFEFSSTVRQNGHEFGRSVTTIRCANGALMAANVWIGRAEPIPAGHPATWAAIALLLTAAGFARLRAGRP